MGDPRLAIQRLQNHCKGSFADCGTPVRGTKRASGRAKISDYVYARTWRKECVFCQRHSSSRIVHRRGYLSDIAVSEMSQSVAIVGLFEFRNVRGPVGTKISRLDVFSCLRGLLKAFQMSRALAFCGPDKFMVSSYGVVSAQEMPQL
jgi:hypothetical protein